MPTNVECIRCKAQMEPGFIADRGYGDWSQPKWSAGPPQRRWWGLKAPPKDAIPVITMRCPRCGVLESYAAAGPGQ
jgi:hypothetical protein